MNGAIDTPLWYILMLLLGLAVGAAIAWFRRNAP